MQFSQPHEMLKYVLNLRVEGCEVLLGRMWGNFDANDDKGDSLILNIKSIWRYLN